MYSNSSQYPDYSNSYPSYQQNYSGYGYQDYNNQYVTTTQPVPPGDLYQQQGAYYGTTGQQNTPAVEVKHDAVAQEMQQQKEQLIKQREDYVKKAAVLRHELDQLRAQKQELVNDGTSDRDLVMILKENDKLQEEIQGKMKAIYNVIEMLSSIIKDGKKVVDLEQELESVKPQESPVATSDPRKKVSPTTLGSETPKKYCYVFYDTGLHWCRTCDEFPETAKEFLQHLQSDSHRETAKENELDTTPWHKLPMEPTVPSFDDAPKQRVPIKGLQFFIPAPAWYCKLCDIWIGDLHCASHHLKSQAHFQNYENFVQQNPHWEMEWLKDREKAMARNGESDEGSKSKKKKRSSLERLKKKKKRSKKRRKHSESDSSSSSSSSDSSSEEDKADTSKSIRVAMRNMTKIQHIMNEDMSKWNIFEKIIEERRKETPNNTQKREKDEKKDDEMISQWMTISAPVDKDKNMLDSLKDRMKAKQEAEKQKHAEIERRRKERERLEQEMLERKKREEMEEAERLERERRRIEEEEFHRITNKDRSHVKFRTARENYRRQRSVSNSDDEEKHYRVKESPRRHRRDSEQSGRGRERSRSQSSKRELETNSNNEKKKPPPPPSYKKLPFIGRMPLFKNKKVEEKTVDKKEIKKEEYEPQRRTRFEPGNIARAFIPQPDVVCFPRLSSIPPLTTIPPAPTVTKLSSAPAKAPEPPKITKKEEQSPLQPPPPPQIALEEQLHASMVNEDNLYSDTGPEMDPNAMGQYYQDYNYSQEFDFQQHQPMLPAEEDVPHSHTLPLEPPPLPPDDDLAMLGICADDMAAQSF